VAHRGISDPVAAKGTEADRRSALTDAVRMTTDRHGASSQAGIAAQSVQATNQDED